MRKYRIDKLGWIENLGAQAVKVKTPSSNCELASFAEARIKKLEQAI